jgi:hypothetical protein
MEAVEQKSLKLLTRVLAQRRKDAEAQSLNVSGISRQSQLTPRLVSNSHYGAAFISEYCVSGILPRFFEARSLSHSYVFKMRIGADLLFPREPEASGKGNEIE